MNFVIRPSYKTSATAIGNKAKNLLVLKKIKPGVVPAFWVITTDSYREVLRLNHFQKPSFFSERNFKLPSPLERELKGLLQGEFNGKEIVVRSSATTEDTPLLTFAGQYTSFLGIRDYGGVINAVRLCYNSLISDNARIYARTHNVILKNQAMAVIIQELAPVTISGVMFTSDPVSGDSGKIIVEYVEGLGEGLTAGEVTPNYHEIHKRQKNSHWLLERLRNFAVMVEEVFGNSRDIEWGYNSETKKFYWFQSRPVIFKEVLVGCESSNRNKKLIATGRTASMGIAVGKLRIIRGKSDFKEIKRGDIVYLATEVSRKLIKYLELSGGLLYQGGILSHCAVIMREFGKPAITNLDSKKRLIRLEGKKISIAATVEYGKIFYYKQRE